MKHYPHNRNVRLTTLAGEFEKVSQNEGKYTFKKSELLLLADYYEHEKFPDKAIEVLDYGISQFDFTSDLHLRKTRLLIYNYKLDQSIHLIGRKRMNGLRPSQVELLQVELLIAHGKIDQALAQLSSLKKKYNKVKKIISEVFYLESLAYEKSNDFEQSFKSLQEALLINDKHQDALGKLWMITELSKNSEKAIVLNQYLLQKEHYSSITWFNIAHAYYSESQYEKAIEAFEFSIIVNEEFESAYIDAAEVCMLLGMYQKASEHLKVVVEDFNNDELYILLQYGESLLKLGESRRAKSILSKGLEIDSEDPDLLYLLAETNRKEGKWKVAVDFYLKALAVDESRDDIHSSLAKMYFDLIEYEKAESHFEEAIAYNPDNSEYHSELASYYWNIGESKMSVETISNAIAEFEDIKLQYHLGAILMGIGEEKQALEVLNVALKVDFSLHEEIYEFAPELELADNKKLKAIINYYQGEQ